LQVSLKGDCFAEKPKDMQELFDIEDAAITTCHPTKYLAPGETIDMEELQDRARSQREIVVGYLDHSLESTILSEKGTKLNYKDVSKLIIMITTP
jgi:hypothetical protein